MKHTIESFVDSHVADYKAGSPSYASDHVRGTVDIYEDHVRRVYKSAPARIVRAFIKEAWQRENIKITGRYPVYTIKTLI